MDENILQVIIFVLILIFIIIIKKILYYFKRNSEEKNKSKSEIYEVCNVSVNNMNNKYVWNNKDDYFYISNDQICKIDESDNILELGFEDEMFQCKQVKGKYIYYNNGFEKIVKLNIENKCRVVKSLPKGFQLLMLNGEDVFLVGSNNDIYYSKSDAINSNLINITDNSNLDSKKIIFKSKEDKYLLSIFKDYRIYESLTPGKNAFLDKLIVRNNNELLYSNKKNKLIYGTEDKIYVYDEDNYILSIIKTDSVKSILLTYYYLNHESAYVRGNKLYILGYKCIPEFTNTSRKELIEDAIIEIDLINDDYKFILKVPNRKGRIVGIYDDNVYTYNKGEIKSINLITNKEILVSKVDIGRFSKFEMCGKYIFIFDTDEFNEKFRERVALPTA